MADYRLLYGDLADGTLLGELPFASLSHTTELNAAGTWSATVPLDLIYATSEDLGPARTVVYVERDGIITGAGIVWTTSADPDAGTVQLAGAGLWSYYQHRTLRANLDAVAVEQTALVAQILAVAHLDGSIGIAVQPAGTGVTRTRTYLGTERKPIAELVDELAAMDDGFDFYVESAWVDGAIRSYLNFAYPATGRNSEHVVELGRNVSGLTVSFDGTGVANLVDGFGGGTGSAQLVVYAYDTTSWGNPYPVLEASINHTDISDAAVLQALTDRRHQRGRQAVRKVSAKVDPGDIEPGSFRVGDIMRVRAQRGWLNVDDQFRVMSVQVAVGDGEELSLELAGLESFLDV